VTAPRSPFLAIPKSDWIVTNNAGFAFSDRYPVTRGHSLVVPHRFITDWWETETWERGGLLELVDLLKERLDSEFSPDGYNVGFNTGVAAGQTVPHFHIHVIPRYSGDVSDPRGGIRHVIPVRANYLTSPSFDSPQLLDGQERALYGELRRSLREKEFDRIDLVVSFIMKSGLAMISDHLEDAIERGATARILTTDYLGITDGDALARLLDLAETSSERLKVRLFSDPTTSFHPKAYVFWAERGDQGRAYVGSSNLSKSGIAGGVEWNVGVEQIAPLVDGFETLWTDPRSRPLTHALLRAYRAQWPTRKFPALEVQPEPPIEPAVPRSIQQEALDALESTRQAEHSAGMVVLATGLGKTWLAAFDTARTEFRRVLFIAHREEILRQGRDIFRNVQPEADLGLFMGSNKDSEAQVVFASVQTLGRQLDKFKHDEFDYIVIDEFHHASAKTYRKVIDHFEPKFLLGLTATPERLDGADLLALCGDNVVFECNLVEGIRRGDLALLNYLGIQDVVDYTPIPWRNGRFDTEVLTDSVSTQARAEQALDEWRRAGGGPTLGFCVTIRHADFMADFFRNAGIAASAVHTGPRSAARHQSIVELQSGRLEVVFSVDMFNEGLDVPGIKTILMLRPTESPVVFLQQLGRGLRRTEGKESLTVIDFIGNHRSFLLKPRTLLGAATGQRPSNSAVVDAMRASLFHLPPGCSVKFDIETVDVLSRLARIGTKSALEEFCRTYTNEEGRRPTAMQAWRGGHNPAAARSAHRSWFGLLNSLELLNEAETNVWNAHGDVLTGLESSQVTKSYKLVTLKALLNDGTLRSGSTISQLAWTAHRIVSGDPRLVNDTRSESSMPDPRNARRSDWQRYWRQWPLAAWAGELRGQPGQWFRIEGEQFLPTFRVDEQVGPIFDSMVAELMDLRLARYLFTKQANGVTGIQLRVSQSNGKPLVWLDRERHPNLPDGETKFIADGTEFVGNFVKIALNVARQQGSRSNDLHELLRRWFGPNAGQAGTDHYVELLSEDGKWTLRASQASKDPGFES